MSMTISKALYPNGSSCLHLVKMSFWRKELFFVLIFEKFVVAASMEARKDEGLRGRYYGWKSLLIRANPVVFSEVLLNYNDD